MSKWNSLLSKIFFRVDSSDHKFIDGVLVNQPDQPEANDYSVKQDSIPKPKEPQYFPIMIPTYPPLFLVDEKPNGDIGLFYHWLQQHKYRALDSYMSDMKCWRENLSGHIDTDAILNVIGKHELTRAKRLMYSLKIYSQYRYDFGDPRIAMILSIDERKLKLPSPKREKFNIVLSPGRIEMLNTQAKALCTEGDRAGIWLGLVMRGVPVSSIDTIEISGNSVRFKKWTTHVEQRFPDWLFLSMTERISEKLWRKNRVTVKKRVSHYETPKVLYKNAPAIIAVLGE